MEIEIDLTKSIEENAGKYFEAAKKAKRKSVEVQKGFGRY